jgi:chaperonin GroES
MKIRPLHDRVVVKRKDADNKTTSGIIIPDTAKEKPLEGKIIAVGSGVRNDNGILLPLGVQKGDMVLFDKYAGTEIMIDGEEYMMMKEDDILGVIE